MVIVMSLQLLQQADGKRIIRARLPLSLVELISGSISSGSKKSDIESMVVEEMNNRLERGDLIIPPGYTPYVLSDVADTQEYILRPDYV